MNKLEQSVAESTRYPIGLVIDVTFEEFSVRLTTLPGSKIRFLIAEGPYAKTEDVDISATMIRPGVFMVSWVEGSGATVVHVEDFANRKLYSHATLPGGAFMRMQGHLRIVDMENI